MEGSIYLTIAYLGMITALGIWTWTVVIRSRRIEARLGSVEASIGIDPVNADELAKLSDDA